MLALAGIPFDKEGAKELAQLNHAVEMYPASQLFPGPRKQQGKIHGKYKQGNLTKELTMKKVLSCALFVLIATGTVFQTFGSVDDAKSKSKSPAKVTEQKSRLLPFHGKVVEVDPKAQTITVGKRVFHLSAATQLMKNKSVIPLKSVEIGERVGGSYRKDEKGTLHAIKLNFKGSTKATRAKSPSKQAPKDDSTS